jgi:hypothetical protein
MVDTGDLKSLGRKAVPVRVRPRAPFFLKELIVAKPVDGGPHLRKAAIGAGKLAKLITLRASEDAKENLTLNHACQHRALFGAIDQAHHAKPGVTDVFG